MLEPHIVKYTHAYFPVGLFDEVNLDHLNTGYVFGRKGDTYVMMSVKSDGEASLLFKNDMEGVSEEELAEDRDDIKKSVKEVIEASGDLRYDLIYTGGDKHAWVTELSSVAQDGSFDAFVERILKNEYSFENMVVNYTTANKTFEVKYDEYFKVNGEVVDTEYGRYENDYVDGKIAQKEDVIRFYYNGKTLVLNYKEGTRLY